MQWLSLFFFVTNKESFSSAESWISCHSPAGKIFHSFYNSSLWPRSELNNCYFFISPTFFHTVVYLTAQCNRRAAIAPEETQGNRSFAETFSFPIDEPLTLLFSFLFCFHFSIQHKTARAILGRYSLTQVYKQVFLE